MRDVNSVSAVDESLKLTGESLRGYVLRFLLGYMVLLNLPFWVISRLTDTYPRGWFNIEYLAIGILGLFVNSSITGILVAFVLLGDIFHTSASFYFFSQQDLINSARFVFALPLSRILGIATTLVLFTSIWSWLAVKIGPDKPRSRRGLVAGCLFCIPLVLLAVDIVNGSNGFLRLRDSRAPYKMASASSISLAKATYLLMYGFADVDFRDVPSASQHFVYMPRPSVQKSSAETVASAALRRPNLSLIVFESFGLFKDAKQQALFNSIFQSPGIRSSYDVEISKVTFKGASVSGEFRELCGIWAGILRQPGSDTLKSKCLPSILAAEGYDTWAYHGFNSYLFNRHILYPQMGFSHIFFREQLLATGLVRDCRGAFIGVCDADIGNMLRNTLEDNVAKPKFVYWLTLDSHLPVPRPKVSSDLCHSDPFFDDQDVCGWLERVHSTLSRIADVATDKKLPPTEFIIVGDHAPPFILQSNRSKFDTQFVPVIHLIPRINASAPSLTSSSAAKGGGTSVHAMKAGSGLGRSGQL